MPIIIKSHEATLTLESIIGLNPATGKPLQGEWDMYERIMRDCEASDLTWCMWYDTTFYIPCGGQKQMQVDFLLICNEGACIVEVKGGSLQIIEGQYHYDYNGRLTKMGRSPFKQADSYKWALINNHILRPNEIFLDYVCAFPHSAIDLSASPLEKHAATRMWNKVNHDGPGSFADFCLSAIRSARKFEKTLSDSELAALIDRLAPTIDDPARYSLTAMSDVLRWLNINNLSVLEGLRKNPRLIIEGGPGTGKTTMAKAYIKRHSVQRGLYLCWTALLASKVKDDLMRGGITQCDVCTYNSFDATGRHYDYVIIDEAQDVADKGVDTLLDTVLSPLGVSHGQYLIFYDLEQGYNNATRNLQDFIDTLAQYAAIYVLDDNKRVPTNKGIVEQANKVLDLEPNTGAYHQYLANLQSSVTPGLDVRVFDAISSLKRSLRQISRNSKLPITLLVHSDLISEYESIGDMDIVTELTAANIAKQSASELYLTTVLKYKGLEDRNIILVIPKNKIKSSWHNFLFELYVGMTRAMFNLTIMIYDN